MFDYLKNSLIIVCLICCIGFLSSGLFYFTLQFEESNLEKIKYCPNCGYDLIEFREV